MHKDDCIFCKISKGDITSITVYEDNEFKVILDKFPGSSGHVLVIPKEHVENIYELSEEMSGKVFNIVANMAKKLKENINIEGLNIVQNNGALAGQSVFHFHIHLIPRYKDDSINIKWKSSEASDEELIELKNKIVS